MAEVDDELWNEFHQYVNMNSRELEDWLRERSAGEDAEAVPHAHPAGDTTRPGWPGMSVRAPSSLAGARYRS